MSIIQITKDEQYVLDESKGILNNLHNCKSTKDQKKFIKQNEEIFKRLVNNVVRVASIGENIKHKQILNSEEDYYVEIVKKSILTN